MESVASRNPSYQTTPPTMPTEERHHAAFEYSELPLFMAKLARNDARLYPFTVLLLRMMVLTFVRTTELIYARWDEIDRSIKKSERS